MATVQYRNAEVLIDAASLRASFNELTVAHAAEMLDETAFGDTTRTNKGGLLTTEISGGGMAEFEANAVADIVFRLVGTDGITIAVWPDGIVEGSQASRGFAMLGVISEFTLGGAVGDLLPFTMTAQGRGLVP